jgi:CHAD domain-containing protein
MANTSANLRIEALTADLLGEGLACLRAHSHEMQDPAKQADPEIVHEARVAVRRMRAALRVFPLEASAGEYRARQANKALKALGSALGEARDWDVIAAELLPARRAVLEKDTGKAAAARLDKKVLGAQMRANAAARKFVAGPPFEAALGPIDRLRIALATSASQPRRNPAALHWVKRQHASVLRKSARLARLDAGARHKLRIECKRLRYAVELCAWEGGRKWLRALKRIQDTLGKATDAHMLAERIATLDPAAGRILRADERECVREQVPEAVKLFREWAKAHAPWEAPGN